MTMKEHFERTIIGGEAVDLNPLMNYLIESPELVSIHVDSLNNASWAEKYDMFLRGLRLLARNIRSEAKLEHVKTIAAVSWIVAEHPEALEKLGFTVDDSNPLAPQLIHKHFRKSAINGFISGNADNESIIVPRFAYMTRQDFLQRYGS